MPFTADEIIAYATAHEGETFTTVHDHREFSVAPEKGGITFITAEKKRRINQREWIEKYVTAFNLRTDYKTTGYGDLRNVSYFLGLAKAMLADPRYEFDGVPTDIKVILQAPETERLNLYKSRIGQGKFRDDLVALRKCCYVTAVSDERFLRASHIKPWKESTNFERLDPHNGLLLCPHFDHLFDNAFISFEDDGRILVSPLLPPDILQQYRVDPSFQGSDLGPQTKTYLRYHRELYQQAIDKASRTPKSV